MDEGFSKVTRRNTVRGVASTWIALAAGLAFAAPLTHAHLDAIAAISHDLCGEHAPVGDLPTGEEPCPTCLGGTHAPAAPAANAALSAPPDQPRSPHAHPADRAHEDPLRHPGAPRAPPRSA